ncbi:MAG: FtsQ-type POTRA domain-containing protein [Alphaproteobacteria bacterium]|nr:FtsQ-type POTRA domain-containing protein [Alphaproteobacteria bacterium]
MSKIGPEHVSGYGMTRVRRILRRPLYYWGLRVFLVICLCVSSWLLITVPSWTTIYEQQMQLVENYLADRHELRLRKVLIHGRRDMSMATLLEVMKVEEDAPLFRVQTEAIEARLQQHPVIKYAHVQFLPPDTLEVVVEERMPIGVWSHQGAWRVFSRDGTILGDMSYKYEPLPRFAGDGAADQAHELIDHLIVYPELMKRLEVAIRVGKRRWTLRLSPGVDIYLPEKNLGNALTELSLLQQRDGVLDRDVVVIDARLSDRWYLRLDDGVRVQLLPGGNA